MRLRNLTNDATVLFAADDRDGGWWFYSHEVKEIDKYRIDMMHLTEQIVAKKLEILPIEIIERFELMDFD